ncbi:MAG: hypothetical protein R3C11_16795 [Planctomycetaceae bacterium]
MVDNISQEKLGVHSQKIPIFELTLARRVLDYHSRLIWYGYGAWDHGEAALIDCKKKNRIGAAIKLNMAMLI